ncbi:MAG: glycosyltransferase [Saprospiraceae bacterium]|nr:glycosyltransferase [Saprospiraceae bacterium]MBK7812743.1 glycosyltransferase [Saprospiraceae bacterium]MBK9630934.1 glycosyltransferase [Saprospiraceae bacterium]
MDMLQTFLIGIYTACLLYMTFFCLVQLNLLKSYRSHRKHKKLLPSADRLDPNLPKVTIQLPIFNEMYVVNRLIDQIVKLDYPKDKMQIQILDDSTDDSYFLAKQKAEEYKALGFDIEHRHRANRQGYKAGALKEGMESATGEFIAIFDADFLPEPDFLLKAIPYFENKNTAVVQSRWTHLNEDYSLLTKLQAFQLNVHFTVEQAGRCEAGHFLQFNGTAGIWRKLAIEDAGGWHSDTLTEDLDLSYRAQLKGWKIKYVEDIVCPAELPVDIYGYKSQQFRWMKGGAENSKKLLPIILKSDLPLKIKFYSCLHLLSSSIFLVIFWVALLSVPVLYIMDDLELKATFLGFCLLGTLSMMSIFYEANVVTCHQDESKWNRIKRFALMFPTFMAVSMGLSFHNSIAVIQGFMGKKSSFVRTPKFSIVHQKESFTDKSYFSSKWDWKLMMECLILCYFGFAIGLGFQIDYFAFMMFHIMLMVGFGINFIYSLRHLNFK